MPIIEQIKTIARSGEFKLKEKGSTFIGKSYLIENEEDPVKILGELKKEYYDATHHCFAYRTIKGLLKYSDDGEPSGTAGIRILNAIEHQNLNNVLLVVIRYYGGTKLGVGPLGRAYYSCAENALEESGSVLKFAYKSIKIISPFNYISNVHRLLSNHEVIMGQSEYDINANFNLHVKTGLIESLTSKLTEISRGEITFSISEEIIYI